MSPLALLAVAVAAAVAAAALGTAGSRGRAGVVVGIAGLLVLLGAALALPGSSGADGALVDGGWFGNLLVGSGYLRLTIVLWSLTALLVAALAWLTGGLRPHLPATLGSIAAGIVALAASDPGVGAAGAVAAGLAGTALVIRTGLTPPGPAGAASGRPAPARVTVGAAHELRMAVASGAAVILGVVVAPAAASLLLADVGSPATDGPSAAASAAVGLALVAIATGTALRLGSIPFHLRVPRLTDIVSPSALPLLLAWGPVPLAAAALAAVEREITPLAIPLDGERALLVGLALLAFAGGAFAAWIRDDLRHLAGYLVIADGGFVLLGLGALQPDAWGPARVWLLVMAVTKTALFAWVAATEARFATRSLADLRGWARRAPLLALGLAVTAVATFGVPGWAAWTARTTLATSAVGAQVGLVVMVAGLLPLLVYARILATGMGRPLSRVDAAPRERLLPVDAPAPSDGGGIAVARRGAATGVAWARTNAAPLASGVVVVLALVALLASWGVADLAGVAAEPPPGVSLASEG